MPTVFTNNSRKRSNASLSVDPTDTTNLGDKLFISHITIYRSGFVLASYLFVLEIIFLLINLLFRLPLGFFISTIAANTLFSIGTFIYLGLIVIKIIFMLVIVFQWAEDYYEIKPGKIIYKSGFFIRKEKEFDCPQISKITLTQGFFGRKFNFGTINLYVNNEEIFSLSNITNPRRNLKIIQKSLNNKSIEITMVDELFEDEE